VSLVAAVLAPLALLLPAANAVETVQGDGPALQATSLEPEGEALAAEGLAPLFNPSDVALLWLIAQGFEPPVQNQVRIEQRVTIRVSPRAAPVMPSMLMELPNRPMSIRPVERDIGNCISTAGIAGVQVARDNRLILYLRDRRVVSASLERSCSARDFYSGFYVERNPDGQICVKRDTLLSRSGVACKMSRIRQLVDPDE